MKRRCLLLLLGLAVTPVGAFETEFASALKAVRELRAEQGARRQAQLIGEFYRIEKDFKAYYATVSIFPNRIFNLRRRSGDPSDPNLARDIRDLLLGIRILRENLLNTVQDQERLARNIRGPDKDLVPPAMLLLRVCGRFESKVSLSVDEAELAAPRLRRAGFSAEAQTLSNGLADLAWLSAQGRENAWTLLRLVQQGRNP